MSDSPPSPTPQRPAVRTAGAPGQRQQVQPGLNLSSIAPQSPPPAPCPQSRGHEGWAGEGLAGTALPFPTGACGDRDGAGPGWPGGVLGGAGRGGCAGVEDTMLTVREREMYEFTARRSWDEKEGGLCRSERDHTDRRVGREMYNTTECFQDPHGPPKAETRLFPSTAERTTQIWGVCLGGWGS